MTQTQAAEVCKATYRTYQNWEYGRSIPAGHALGAVLDRMRAYVKGLEKAQKKRGQKVLLEERGN
jgi:hypothetical protein